MLFLKYLLEWGGIGMIAAAIGILAHDFYFELMYRRAVTLAQHRFRKNRRFAGAGLWCSQCLPLRPLC